MIYIQTIDCPGARLC